MSHLPRQVSPARASSTQAASRFRYFLQRRVAQVFPAVLAAATYLPCAVAADEKSQAVPAMAPQYADQEVRDIPRDLAVLVARHLYESRLPALARSHVLTAAWQRFIDPEDGPVTQALIDWYEQQPPLERTRYISRVLEDYWTRAEYNAFILSASREQLQRGALAEAARILREMRDPLDAEFLEQRESLTGLIQLLQHNTADAVNTLEQLQGFPNSRRLDHFNYAIAITQHGRSHEGLALLDELAGMPGSSPLDQTVSDRANMALGWIWLRQQQGATARAAFKRVSLNGPYSNLALLGLGWTELLPDGQLQKIRFKRTLRCKDIRTPPEGTRMTLFNSYQTCTSNNKESNFVYFRSFAHEPGGTSQQRLTSARRWLRELASRDISEPAVQESLLALGYVNARQGHVKEALGAYKAAIRRYDAEIARLDGLSYRLRQPEVDFETLLNDQAHPGQFAELKSSHPYTRLVADLGLIGKTGEELSATRLWLSQQYPSSKRRLELANYVATELERQADALANMKSAKGNELSRLVAAKIAETKSRLEKYRAEAVLATARLYDKPKSRDRAE